MVRRMRVFEVRAEVDNEVNDFLMDLAGHSVRKATVDLHYVVSRDQPAGKYEVAVLYREPAHRTV